MRKSAISLAAVAVLAASSFAVDVATAQRPTGGGGGAVSAPSSGGGGGGGRTGGGPAPSFSGSAAPSGGSFGGRIAGPTGAPMAPRAGIVGPTGQRYSGTYQQGGVYYDKHGHRHHHRRHFVGGPFFGFYGGYYNDYAYYDDCYQVRRVRTPYGWRWRRVYVCDYYPY